MAMININVYRAGDEWYGAVWVDGEYDSCDTLGVESDASEDEAMAAAKAMPLLVGGERTVTRVSDVS